MKAASMIPCFRVNDRSLTYNIAKYEKRQHYFTETAHFRGLKQEITLERI